jgi:hypothetical protein
MFDWLVHLYRPKNVIEWIALVIYFLLIGSTLIFRWEK